MRKTIKKREKNNIIVCWKQNKMGKKIDEFSCWEREY